MEQPFDTELGWEEGGKGRGVDLVLVHGESDCRRSWLELTCQGLNDYGLVEWRAFLWTLTYAKQRSLLSSLSSLSQGRLPFDPSRLAKCAYSTIDVWTDIDQYGRSTGFVIRATVLAQADTTQYALLPAVYRTLACGFARGHVGCGGQ